MHAAANNSDLARCAKYSLRPSSSSRRLIRWLDVSTRNRIGAASSERAIFSTRADSQIAWSMPIGDPAVAPTTCTALRRRARPCRTTDRLRSRCRGRPGTVKRESQRASSALSLCWAARASNRSAAMSGTAFGSSIPSAAQISVASGASPNRAIRRCSRACSAANMSMSRCAGRERGDGGVAECCCIVVHEDVGAADQGTILAAHRPPDEGAVARIELLDALVGFDHLRARHADTSLFGYDQRRAAARYQPTAAKAARPPRPSCAATSTRLPSIVALPTTMQSSN